MKITINDPRMETTEELDVKDVLFTVQETEEKTFETIDDKGKDKTVTIKVKKEEQTLSVSSIESQLNMLERNKEALQTQIVKLDEQIANLTSKKETAEELVATAMESKPVEEIA